MKLLRALCLVIVALLPSAGPMAAKSVALSEHFAVEQVSPLLGSPHQAIYARDSRNDRLKPIGTTMPAHWDRPFSGPSLEALAVSLMAVSSDGRTLLYWHKNMRHSSVPAKAEGIYRHRIGEGESLLHPDGALTVRWARYDKPLPKQLLVVVGRLCPNEEQCALNADDGRLAPLAMHGATPLHRAAYANDLEAARTALAEGGGVDAETYWGFTALQVAVKKGHDDIALLLLAQGADARRRQGAQLSPLQLAVHLQRWPLLDALGSAVADPALLRFAFTRPRGFVQFIADDTTAHRQDAVPRLVRLMLACGLDPTATTEPLVYWLLARHPRGTPALMETLKLLIDHGARADTPDPGSQETPLHLLAGDSWPLAAGAREAMDLLIPKMQSLEGRDSFGLTALQTAMLMPDRGDGFAKALHLIRSGADDKVEYLCGSMRTPSRISIRQKLAEWHGVLPKTYDCGAYR